MTTLQTERTEIAKHIPLLDKSETIDTNIKQYCHAIHTDFESLKDFDSKRKFLLDRVDKIIYANEEVSIAGSICLLTDKKSDNVATKIEFLIPGEISDVDRFNRHYREQL